MSAVPYFSAVYFSLLGMRSVLLVALSDTVSRELKSGRLGICQIDLIKGIAGKLVIKSIAITLIGRVSL